MRRAEINDERGGGLFLEIHACYEPQAWIDDKPNGDIFFFLSDLFSASRGGVPASFAAGGQWRVTTLCRLGDGARCSL